MTQTLPEAGKVSTRNSKMPGSSFATSTDHCLTGSKLVHIPGSVCHKCYAVRVEKRYPNAKLAYERNYLQATALIATKPEAWAKAMAFQITQAALKTHQPYHRWFDSGDLASPEMLHAIVLTAKLTPDIKHWLPTREAKMVKDYLTSHTLPPNLTIRVSSPMIDDGPLPYPNTSTVHTHTQLPPTPDSHVCPSTSPAHRSLDPDNRPNCGYCRACWDISIPNISYPQH